MERRGSDRDQTHLERMAAAMRGEQLVIPVAINLRIPLMIEEGPVTVERLAASTPGKSVLALIEEHAPIGSGTYYVDIPREITKRSKPARTAESQSAQFRGQGPTGPARQGRRGVRSERLSRHARTKRR